MRRMGPLSNSFRPPPGGPRALVKAGPGGRRGYLGRGLTGAAADRWRRRCRGGGGRRRGDPRRRRQGGSGAGAIGAVTFPATARREGDFPPGRSGISIPPSLRSNGGVWQREQFFLLRGLGAGWPRIGAIGRARRTHVPRPETTGRPQAGPAPRTRGVFRELCHRSPGGEVVLVGRSDCGRTGRAAAAGMGTGGGGRAWCYCLV